MTDAALIEAYLSGDVTAFETLYRRYRKPLYTYLNTMTRANHAFADDVFQLTWVKVSKKLSGFDTTKPFFAWLCRIAHNCFVDACRKEERETAKRKVLITKPYDETSVPAAVAGIEQRELKNAIKEAVEQLPDEQAEVFVLRQQGLGFKEIAQVQDVTINTALARMQYAMKKMKALLNEWR